MKTTLGSGESLKLKMSDIAREYAIACHQDCNQKYDKAFPYSFHLGMVANIANKFIHLLPEDEDIREDVIASCWTHDLIEDARQTYNDVKKSTNERVAELTYALTNEKGRNRAARANDKYYEGIRNTPFAIFVKLCDRIANVQHSKNTNSRMLDLYRKENADFCAKIYDAKYQEMFDLLNYFLKDGELDQRVV